MVKEDPTKVLTVSGKLVNHQGAPVTGADLHLIVARNRSMVRERPPYDWASIEAGRTENSPNVLKVPRQRTGADGSFTFRDVPADAEYELLYSGKGIPRGRMDHLEKLPENERLHLVVKALAPARLVGTIDRQAFPKLQAVSVQSGDEPGFDRNSRVPLSDDGKGFVASDLAPGRYTVVIRGVSSNGFAQAIARKSIKLESGKETKITLGEEDRTPSPPRRLRGAE